MKLSTFTHNGVTSIGLISGERVVDIALAFPGLPREMEGLLREGSLALATLHDLELSGAVSYPLKSVRLEAPVRHPSKILAIGLNYHAHTEEVKTHGIKAPVSQLWFNKQVSSVNAPFDPIQMPRISNQLDYELELGVVIGKRCRHVMASEAAEVIAGYTIVNDVSVRDVQLSTPTWTIGKSFDTHCPIGPWLVTTDEIPDPHNLDMKLWVNGELRQSTNTSLMINNIYQQIEHLTRVMTLEPGDILVTGTPVGVGMGSTPPRWLKVGDVVRLEIERIGEISHVVVEEPLSS